MSQKVVVFGVDPQNDFGNPRGSLYCRGGFKVVGGGMILIEYAKENGWPTMFSADDHPQNSDHFKPHGPWPPHCVHDTWGAEFLPGIEIDPDQHIFHKGTRKEEHGYDPFEGDGGPGRSPEQVMGDPKNTTIIAWGIATNYCVRTFVLTARKKGYKVYVVLDACRAVPTPPNPPSDFITEGQAIQDMKDAGAIMTTVEEVVSGRI